MFKFLFVAEQPFTVYSNEPALTSAERGQVKAGARWLRRVANPFADFHVIVTVGIAASSTTDEASQGQDNPDVEDCLKDVYVLAVSAGPHKLTPDSCSTPVQREIYASDLKQIIKHMPFLKARLGASSVPSREIQKILNTVCAHRYNKCPLLT